MHFLSPHSNAWRVWPLVALFACIRFTTADNPILLSPSSEPPGPPPFLTSPHTPPIPPNYIPLQPPPSPPFPTSSSSTPSLTNAVVRPSPKLSKKRPKKSPKKTSTSRNKAAASLKLVHVPLKVSCDILRQFYIKTGGVNWSNQDGWQFVDSVTIMSVPPRGGEGTEGGQGGDGGSGHFAITSTGGFLNGNTRRALKGAALPHRHAPLQPQTAPFSAPITGTSNVQDLPAANAASPSSYPLLPPIAAAIRIAGSDSGDIGEVPPGFSQDSLADTTGNLDPNNCCGWYGVVCIGPDGAIPQPWPPYDDDLIINRIAARTDADGGDGGGGGPSLPPTSLLRKRGGVSAPYYNYHDRKSHRHAKDGGQGRGRGGGGNPRGTGGSDNRHQPDEGNNENGPPSDAYDGNANGGIDDDDDDVPDIGPEAPPPLPPSISYGGTVGNHGQQVDEWYIVELHLGFNGLTGPVPEELSGLVNLIILDIGNNELTGQIPESYGRLIRLKRLDVTSNQITGPFPVAVTQMVSMQELVLKNNYITGSLPPGLSKLKQLTELSIENNEFDGLLPSGLFSSLTMLRVINLSQNGFTGEIDAEIGSLADLITISASANEFHGSIPKEIGNCKQLQIISLGDNHLTGEIPETLYSLQNLQVLDLPDNRLSGHISPKIGNMISMTRLILSHNDLGGPLPVEIQNLTQLEYMVLNYNSLDGTFPTVVAPPLITVCLMQPNAFTACPPNASLETATTLAYQCNLDCRDRVIHPETDSATSQAASRAQGSLLGLSMVLFTAVVHIL